MWKKLIIGLALCAFTAGLRAPAFAAEEQGAQAGSAGSAGGTWKFPVNSAPNRSNNAPPVISAPDPDCTSYPYINNWKDHLNRDVTVFLNDPERHQLTADRVTESDNLAPIFLHHENAIRATLHQDQGLKFEAIVQCQDMERLAAMDVDGWSHYYVMLSQRLHLDGQQEADVRLTLNHLMADLQPVRTQYAAAFDQEIAAAEARAVAERQQWTIIGTPPTP